MLGSAGVSEHESHTDSAELGGGWGSSDSLAGLMWWQPPATSPGATPAVCALGRALSQHKGGAKGDVGLRPPQSRPGKAPAFALEGSKALGDWGLWHEWVAQLGQPGMGMNVEKTSQIQWFGGHLAVGKHLAGQEKR